MVSPATSRIASSTSNRVPPWATSRLVFPVVTTRMSSSSATLPMRPMFEAMIG